MRSSIVPGVTLISFVLLYLPESSLAATCSCAGVPLLGMMETSSPDEHGWYIGTTYEVHEIDDLVRGSDDVRDETGRERSTRSFIAETSYGFNDKWSISGLFSVIEHERRIGSGKTDSAKGIGDSIAMVKYTPTKVGLFSRNGLSFGLGAKIPTGDDEEKALVLLSEDMQPSTGAWSAIFWAHAAHSFSQSAKTQIFASTSYSRNYENDRDYQFGDEFTFSLGGSYRMENKWRFAGTMRYRTADRDQRNSSEIPNTGGDWLDFVPTVQYQFTDQLAGKVSARIPVWRDLNDALQFTTRYAVSLSVSYVL